MLDPRDSTPVSAVIVTYNGEAWLESCLTSLTNSTTPPAIIVVDNASTDRTVEIVQTHRDVTLIQSPRNIGFGRANNIGIARAIDLGAQFVFLVNQDAHVAPNAIEMLLQEASAHPRLGILSPLQLDDTGHTIDRSFLQYYLAPSAPQLIDDALLRKPAHCYPVPSAPAAAWLVTRKCLTHVGGFDPLFFMYCEDDDLCNRARTHGFEVAIVPDARFFHCRGFHGKVAAESRTRRLARKTSRFRSIVIRDAKHPEGSIGKNTWHTVIAHLCDGIENAVSHLDWLYCLASILAVVRVLVELPQIARHRTICLRAGPHWLPLAKPVTQNTASEN